MTKYPIINTPANASGKTNDASKGRIRSIKGGGPNYSGGNATRTQSPPPNSPYGKGG